MAANTAGKGGKASVSLRWFQAVLFLLAVPPPVGHAGTPSSLEFGLSLLAGHTGDFLFLLPDVLRLLAALVIGFLVWKAVGWKKCPREQTAADNPWFIMVLLLVAGSGIMASVHECLFKVVSPRVVGYPLPLYLALGFIIYRAALRAEPGPVELFRPKNPWLGVLLIVIGFPAVAVYLDCLPISLVALLIASPQYLLFVALLCLFSVIVYLAGRSQRKERRAAGKREKNAWLSLLLHSVAFLPVPLAASALVGTYIVEFMLSPLRFLPSLLVLSFCGYKAMTWKQQPPAEA